MVNMIVICMLMCVVGALDCANCVRDATKQVGTYKIHQGLFCTYEFSAMCPGTQGTIFTGDEYCTVAERDRYHWPTVTHSWENPKKNGYSQGITSIVHVGSDNIVYANTGDALYMHNIQTGEELLKQSLNGLSYVYPLKGTEQHFITSECEPITNTWTLFYWNFKTGRSTKSSFCTMSGLPSVTSLKENMIVVGYNYKKSSALLNYITAWDTRNMQKPAMQLSNNAGVVQLADAGEENFFSGC